MMVRGNSGYGYTHPSDGHTDPGDMYSGEGYTDSSYVYTKPDDGWGKLDRSTSSRCSDPPTPINFDKKIK